MTMLGTDEGSLEAAPYQPVVAGAPWAFIAVMGVTGSGKSSFIRSVSGDRSCVVGDGLKSCTSDLKGYNFHCKGFNVNLVDSPGFNDTFRSETDVLQDIASWLKETYENKEDNKLSGIVYLHGINHSRMEGSALRNLKMFRELCGPDPLKNVVLATTFWGLVDAEVGASRERELAETPEFWAQMIARGSRMARFQGFRSGIDIIASLLDTEPKPLKIQRELVEEDISLVDTGAGRIVNEELARLEKLHQKEKLKMQKEMQEALEQRDSEMQEILQAEQERVDQEISKVQRQQEQLRADRRAETRRLQNDFESQLYCLREQNSDLQDRLLTNDRDRQMERAEQERRIRNLERYNEEAKRKWPADMNVDEVIARVRAEESKLRVDERERLEAEIAKLKDTTLAKPDENTPYVDEIDSDDTSVDGKPQKDPSRWKKRGKAAGSVLMMGLRAVLPIATLITLGMPISI